MLPEEREMNYTNRDRCRKTNFYILFKETVKSKKEFEKVTRKKKSFVGSERGRDRGGRWTLSTFSIDAERFRAGSESLRRPRDIYPSGLGHVRGAPKKGKKGARGPSSPARA